MSTTQPTPPTDSPDVLELFDAIRNLLPEAISFDGVVVRSVGMKFANSNDFFSGEGAARWGGRWNRRGLRAIYASLDVMTATAEAYQNLLAYGFTMTSIKPRVFAGARVSLSNVLDLTDLSILSNIGYTLNELVEEEWKALQEAGEESWTQAIGRGCFLAGFEAIIVPSARSTEGRNIVLFPEGLAETSRIEILGRDELPE